MSDENGDNGDEPTPVIPENPPPSMRTSGIGIDSNGDIWLLDGKNGLIKIGSYTGP
jgi:hypothetical protein